MGITFKSGVKEETVKDGLRANLRKNLEKAMELAATEIIRRTQSGKDADGRKFKKYTKRYAAIKKETGKGRNVSTVDLTLEGPMLKAIHSKVKLNTRDRLEGIIHITDKEQASKARGNMKKRKFFAFSKKQRKDLLKIIRRNLINA